MYFCTSVAASTTSVLLRGQIYYIPFNAVVAYCVLDIMIQATVFVLKVTV